MKQLNESETSTGLDQGLLFVTPLLEGRGNGTHNYLILKIICYKALYSFTI